MWRIRSIVLIMTCLLLPGCTQSTGNDLANEVFDTDDMLPRYDSQSKFCLPVSCLVETEQAYYGRVMGTHFLNYYDKESGETGILCGRLDCSHDDLKCNGYVGWGAIGLSVYDEKIYWTMKDPAEKNTIDHYIWRMNLDGTDRERLQEVRVPELNTNVIIQIHRGYIYTVGTALKVVEGRSEEHIQVYAEKMGEEGSFVSILDIVYDSPMPYCNIKLLGNSLYIMISHYKDEGNYSLVLYEWDIQSRQMITLMEEEGIAVEPWSFSVTAERELYWIGWDPKDSMPAQVHRYNPETKEGEFCFDMESMDYLSGQLGDGVIASVSYEENDAWLRVKDMEGNTLYDQQITFPGQRKDISYMYTFYGGDQEYVYYEAMERSEEIEYPEVHMIRIPIAEQKEGEFLW